jgi:hypothetical protein
MSKIEYCKQHVYTPYKGCVYCERDKLAEELEVLQQQLSAETHTVLELADQLRVAEKKIGELKKPIQDIVDWMESVHELVPYGLAWRILILQEAAREKGSE